MYYQGNWWVRFLSLFHLLNQFQNYKYCTIAVKKKKARPSWYFCNACLISLKNPNVYYNKQVNDLKTVTYDSFAIVPPNKDVSTRKKVEDLIKKKGLWSTHCFSCWPPLFPNTVLHVAQCCCSRDITCLPCLEPLPETLITFLWPPMYWKRVHLNAIDVYVICSGLSVMEGTFSSHSLYGYLYERFHDISMLVQYKLVWIFFPPQLHL